VLEYIQEINFLLGNERKKVLLLLVISLFSALLDLVGLGLIGPYIGLVIQSDFITEGKLHDLLVFFGMPLDQQQLLIWLGMTLVLIFLLKAGASILIDRAILIFCYKQQIRIKSFLMQAFQQMTYTEFLKRNSAEYIQSIQNNTGIFGGLLQTCFRSASQGVVGLAIFVMLSFYNAPALILLIFLLITLVLGYDIGFRRKVQNYGKIAHNASTSMIQGIHEGIEGLKEIRILGKEDYFHNKVRSSASINAENQIKSSLITVSSRYLLDFLLVLFVVSLVISSVMFGEDLHLLVPTLGIFGVASLRLIPLANLFSNTLTRMRYSRHAVSILHKDLLSFRKKNQIRKKLLPLLSSRDTSVRILIKNVSYFYPNTNFPALKNISLKIRNGESVGLVGTSGSGKTTMVDVLLGLLEPADGEIYHNGINIRSTEVNLNSQIAYLPQEVFLIDNSLRHNVALGMEGKEIDDQKVLEALLQARLMDLVQQLPAGINSMLGEHGVRLSGGQKQRVALARAFYHERDVLVMDEATSALDNDTEREIVDEIKWLKGKKTMIIIAHRDTTVQHCDSIYRLEKGEIVKQGTYEEVFESP
jgi:ATP-binding cassette, subfamily B, bacterial PglK